MIMLLVLYKFIALAQFTISLGPLLPNSSTPKYIVYQNGVLNADFDSKSLPTMNCQPSKLQYFKSPSNQLDSYTPLVVMNTGNKDFALQEVTVSNLDDQVIRTFVEYERFSIIKSQTQKIVTIGYQCEKEINKYNYWAIVKVKMSFDNYPALTFYYQFLCDANYHPTRFDVSYLLLLLIMSVTVFFLSKFQKLRTFKFRIRIRTNITNDNVFQGIYIGFKASVIYLTLVVISFILALIYKEEAEIIEENIVMGFTLFMGYVFLNECQYKLQSLRRKLLYSIRICDLISSVTIILVVYTYIHFNKPWIISDILTIFILGACIKLFKIISLKDAVHFYALCILADIVLSLYSMFHVRQEWDSLLLKYFNTPLAAQIPYFHQIYKKKCGWISITTILFPSFFLAYAHRFDRSRDTIIYRSITLVGLINGLIIWFILSSLYSIPLPVSIFTLIPMLGIGFLVSYQRNEFKTFWVGYFYDQCLLNPFRHTLRSNRSSIKSINLGVEPVEQSVELQQFMNEKSEQPLVRNSQGVIKINDDVFNNLLL